MAAARLFWVQQGLVRVLPPDFFGSKKVVFVFPESGRLRASGHVSGSLMSERLKGAGPNKVSLHIRVFPSVGSKK